nr:radical SAM protein [Paenibacillus dakarensis]
MQTNGTLIDDRWASFFKTYNFLIGVSLDGPKEIHDSRRVNSVGIGSYNRVMAGIEHLRNHQVDFNILMVIHKGNVGKAKELMEFYRRTGVGSSLAFYFLCKGRSIRIRFSLRRDMNNRMNFGKEILVQLL